MTTAKKITTKPTEITDERIDGRSMRKRTGKSRNPDYTSLFVTVQKSTKQQVAMRLLQMGEDGPTFSDLVDGLLADWLKTKTHK